VRTAREQKIADDAYLLRDWRRWHREQLDEALVGPHGNMLQSLMVLLKNLNLQSGKELISFIRAQDWHVVDAQTKLVILHTINTAITKLRTGNSMSPFDDGLPGGRSNVFQAIRLIVVPVEAKPAENCSANQEH
jgi:hypothetical protein